MKSKRRLTQVFLLLLSGVSLTSILVIAGIWIAGDVSESTRQERVMAERFELEWRESLRLEIQRVTSYISEVSAGEQLETLLRAKARAEEILAALAGALEDDPGIASDPSRSAALLAMLRHLTLDEGRERLVCIDLATGTLLTSGPPGGGEGGGEVGGGSGAAPGSGASASQAPGPRATPVVDGEGFRRVTESVRALGAAFYGWDFLGGGRGGGREPLTYLAVFEPLGWAVGVCVFPEVFVSEQEREIQSWADGRALPPGMSFLLLSFEGDVLAGGGGAFSGNIFDSDGGTGLAEAAARIIRGARAVGWDSADFTLRDPESGEETRALGYYRAVPGKPWVAVAWVGTGLLERGLADERAALRSTVDQSVTRTGLITLTVLALVALISRILARMASRSFTFFFQFFERASSTSVLLDPGDQPFQEFARLAVAANRMIETRDRAEEMLRVNEARFRAIFDVSPQAVCVFDEDGALLEANSHFPALTGIPLADALGRRLDELMGSAAGEAFREVAAASGLGASTAGDAAPAGDGGPASGPGSADTGIRAGRELEFRRPDGTEAMLLFLGAPLRLTTEHRILGIFIDMTAQRAVEREKALLRERLSRAQGLETLGIMASETAHELNNILSGITGYPELLLREGGLTASQRASVGEILSAGRRAADVVGDLLTLAQGVAVKSEILDLNEMVREVLADPTSLAAPAGPGRGEAGAGARPARGTVTGGPDPPGGPQASAPCTQAPGARPPSGDGQPVPAPETAFHPGPLWVEAPRARLRKAVQAIVSNAVNAAGLAEGTRRWVRIETAAEPGGGGAGARAVLRVSDGGPGIPPEERARVLDPFYTGRHWAGRGLGLTLAANTVRGLGGDLDFRTGDAGTEFSLWLPARDAPHAGQPRRRGGGPVVSDSWKGKGERVLVVDDVDIQRKLAGKMLQSLGYSPVAVSSGEEAVEYLRDNDADVLLLDMIMRPGINGREAYERILGFKPGQRAVIASGMAEGDEVERARALGASHFIMKPYSLEELARILKQALAVAPEGPGPRPAEPE
ncbi:MAG: response regulator [Deltaproteobacteria bacterium]|jgi:signal transduction histidine kinase/CheY-like chemotaxis protein|nr:response regulator [Deltaproteobacteria bacterium]